MPNTNELESVLQRIKSNHSFSDNEYYNSMRELAELVRRKHGIHDKKMGLRLMRQVYKKEGIRIDPARKKMKKVRGAYFCEDGDYSVLISPLPNEPKLFTLAHELKHHLVDQNLLMISCVDVTTKSDRIEIGAEVFAADFIFPTPHFIQCLEKMNITNRNCKAEDVCRLKEEYEIPLSYQSICKRLYILKVVQWGNFDGIKFTKVHESLYGEPVYKRVQRYRKRNQLLQ